MTIQIAAKNSSFNDRNDADIVCNGDDVTRLARAFAEDGTEIQLALGRYDANAGRAADGTRYLRVGKGTTIKAAPGTELRAEKDVCRITLDEAGANLIGITTWGWIGIQAHASDLWLDHVSVIQSLEPGKHLDFGGRGGCTGAIQFWGPPNGTMRNIRLTNIRIEDSYHHGLGFHLDGAQQGTGNGLGTFADVLIDSFVLLRCGSGYIKGGKQDWSCAMDNDTGNALRWRIRNGLIRDSWQSALHWDGSWTGHRQDIVDLVVEDVEIWDAGQRSAGTPKERYQSGVYAPAGTFRRMRTSRCYNCGGLFTNETADSLVIEDWIDDGSTVGIAIEYGGHGARVQAELRNNRYRAYQAMGDDQIVDLTLVNPPKNPILLGGMEKRIYFEAPEHKNDLAKYLAKRSDMSHGSYTIRTAATGTLWTVPAGSKSPRITLLPIAVAPETPPPFPIPQGSLYLEDGDWIWFQPPECRPQQWELNGIRQRIPPDIMTAGGKTLRALYGAVRVAATGIAERTLGFLPDEYREFYRDVRGEI
jgi:hypothetical protein